MFAYELSVLFMGIEGISYVFARPRGAPEVHCKKTKRFGFGCTRAPAKSALTHFRSPLECVACSGPTDDRAQIKCSIDRAGASLIHNSFVLSHGPSHLIIAK